MEPAKFKLVQLIGLIFTLCLPREAFFRDLEQRCWLRDIVNFDIPVLWRKLKLLLTRCSPETLGYIHENGVFRGDATVLSIVHQILRERGQQGMECVAKIVAEIKAASGK